MQKKQYIAIAVILLITALLAGAVQYLNHVSMPEDWHVTAVRSGELFFDIPNPEGDRASINYPQSRPVKRGETFRVLGHNTGELWVEAANGERGMIDQLLVTDTVITIASTVDYPAGRMMLVEDVDWEDHSVQVRDLHGQKYTVPQRRVVRMMDIFRHPEWSVRKKGYGCIRSELFAEEVVGKSLAHLDSTFAPVLYYHAGKAVLSRRVYDLEEHALYLPVLPVNQDGIVTSGGTYTNPVKELSGTRTHMSRFPGVTYMLDHGQSLMDQAGLYEWEHEGSDVRRRMRWHRDPEIPARTGARKFFGFFGDLIGGLLLLLPVCAIWCWYYGVTFFLLPVILIQVARSPKPFERLSNEQMSKMFEWMLYPLAYIAFVVGVSNLDTNLFWCLAGISCAYGAVRASAQSLVEDRCPDCKHTYCYELIRTEWGKAYYSKEMEKESYRTDVKKVGSTREFTEVSGLGATGAHVAEVDVTVTNHYDVTTHHDQYEVTYEHKNGVEYWRCRHCGHVKVKDTKKTKRVGRELVGGYDTHHQEHDSHRGDNVLR